MLKKAAYLLITCAFALPAMAQDNIFTDSNFGADDFKLVSKDLSAAFAHTTNSGGSTLGSLWGVEAGIVIGALETDSFKSIAERFSGTSQDELGYLPYAGIVAGLALPFGIGGEISLIPEIDIDDGSFSNMSARLRWSITDMIPLVGSFSPLKITTHFSYGTTDLDYTFDLSGNAKETAKFSIDNTEIGVTAGFNLFLIEPYIGLSSVKADSKLTATLQTSLPIPPGIGNQSLKSSPSGTRAIVGILLKLPLLRFGLEASQLHSTTRYTFKMSLKI